MDVIIVDLMEDPQLKIAIFKVAFCITIMPVLISD